MANKIMRSTLAGVLAVLSVAAYVPGTAVSTFFADTAITASASSVYGDFTYDELAGGSLSITKYSGHDTKVTIPSEINGSCRHRRKRIYQEHRYDRCDYTQHCYKHR